MLLAGLSAALIFTGVLLHFCANAAVHNSAGAREPALFRLSPAAPRASEFNRVLAGSLLFIRRRYHAMVKAPVAFPARRLQA